MEFLYLAVLGIVTGGASALFGIGGGMIIVPSMLYSHYFVSSLDFSTHEAIGISVIQMIFSSVFGTIINFFKKKNLNIEDALFLGMGGIIGASCSGIVLDIITPDHLTLLFLIVSCITFYKFLRGSTKNTHHINISNKQKNKVLVIIGSLTGVFAVSLGIGGGVLLTPLLMYYLGFDTKKIVPLSLFFIMCAAIAGTISLIHHSLITNTVLEAGLVLGVFSLFGVIIGQRLIDIISLQYHKIILLVLYAISIIATFNKVLVYYDIY